MTLYKISNFTGLLDIISVLNVISFNSSFFSYRESITDYVKNCIKKIMEIGGNKEKLIHN